MVVPGSSFSRYELILRGSVSDIDQNHDNLDFYRLYAIKVGKTQITLVLEGFRTNQAYHSDRLGKTVTFGEKIRKSFHYIIFQK